MPRTRRSTAGSVLDFAILGLLKEQELHGYEIRRRLSEILGPIARLSFGTLYPALNRLETEGSVEVVQVTKSRTGLTTERGRKVYALTGIGKDLFDELLEATAGKDEDERTFAIRLAFAQYLPREARLRFLVHRREQVQAQLEETQRALGARTTKLDDYRRSLMEHNAEVQQIDVAWLDRLISQERPAPDEPAAKPVRATRKKTK